MKHEKTRLYDVIDHPVDNNGVILQKLIKSNVEVPVKNVAGLRLDGVDYKILGEIWNPRTKTWRLNVCDEYKLMQKKRKMLRGKQFEIPNVQ